jgi:hypothetical protein
MFIVELLLRLDASRLASPASVKAFRPSEL